MRRAANVDACQADIVASLRKSGVTVLHLHALGSGVPDLLCGYRGVNVLLELKTPKHGTKPGTKATQSSWHETWGGQVATVTNFSEAMDAILMHLSTIYGNVSYVPSGPA